MHFFSEGGGETFGQVWGGKRTKGVEGFEHLRKF